MRARGFTCQSSRRNPLSYNLHVNPCSIAVLVIALHLPHLTALPAHDSSNASLISESNPKSVSLIHSSQNPSIDVNIHTGRSTNQTTLNVNRTLSSPSKSPSTIRVLPLRAPSRIPNKSKHLLDRICQLTNITRPAVTSSEDFRTEVALNCDHVHESNLEDVVSNIERSQRIAIQQYHFTNSDPSTVLRVLEATCEQFDCSDLTVFNVSGQKILDKKELANKIESWRSLEILDLSRTSIDSIEYLWMSNSSGVSITQVYLDDNYISTINFTHLVERLPSLKHFSIINNTIEDIFCNEDSRSQVFNQLETISLAGNSINCNKSQLWLLKHFQDQNFKFPDYDLIRCSSPENLIDMTWSQRVSVLETPICDGCDCKSLKRTAISVDCHNKNLTALPDILPLNAKVLNLTSNRILSLGVPQNSKNWENVTYVYLENNLISSFQPLEINSKFMRNLAALDIRRNKFQEFPSHIFEQFINLDQVHLSNNPWLCDCESTFAFQEWLQRQFHKVGDKEEIRCGISGSDVNGLKSINLEQRLSSRVIYRLSKSELCPQDGLEEPWHWLDAVNWGLGAVIILILVKLTLDYIYQHKTKRLPHFFKLNL